MKQFNFYFLASLLIILFGISAIFIACEKEEENKLPTCTISFPNDGDEFEVGETINIFASASDADGSITEVKFKIDNETIGTATSSPYTLEWNTAGSSGGNKTLTAIATDDKSDTASSSINIKLILVGDPPSAAFTSSQTSVSVGESVNFTDQSTNEPTSWSWDFGDGGTSSLQNPSHTYENEGTYTVALTVTNAIGSDTETKTNYISVSSGGEAPVVSFIASPTTVDVGATVNFTDLSGNNPTSWNWNFGDGVTSGIQNPTHSYTTAGVYSVTLIASNIYGSNSQTKTNYITVNSAGTAPVAEFSSDKQTASIGETISFTDLSTNGPTSWSWNFGDETNSYTQNPTHSYSVAGTYNVTLTVANAYGTDSETKSSYITIQSGGSSGVNELFENFSGVSEDANVSITDWLNIAEAGEYEWVGSEFNEEKYVKFTSYGSSDEANIGWLITPLIDFDASSNKYLSFYSAQAYWDHNGLSVWLISDLEGENISGATKTQLYPLIANQNSYEHSWVFSENLNLSSYSGTHRIGFKYEGSQSAGEETTYRIDDVRISTEPAPKLYLLGDGCAADWDKFNPLEMTDDGSGIYTITTTLYANNGLKVLHKPGNWAPQYGTDESGTGTGGNLVFRPTESDTDPIEIPTPGTTGTYIITVNLNTMTYTITAN